MVRIGVIGTGGMANVHARAFGEMRGCKVVAACDIVEDRVRAFGERHGISALYTNLERMLAEAELDAVTNVTSDAAHCPTTLAAVRKGLHVLCEKPLAVSYAEARRMVSAAKRKGVINMVNLSYRNSSAIHRAHNLVRQGRIGDVRHVEAGYLQGWLSAMDWRRARRRPGMLWRLSSAHGSKGVLGDLGVHILDFTSYAVGDIRTVDCRLQAFPKLKGNRIGEYRFDANDSAVMTVEFSGGALGVVHTTRWATGQNNSVRLRVYGTKGSIIVDLDESYGELKLCRKNKEGRPEWQTVKCAPTPSIYKRFVKSIRTGVNDQPDFARGATIQKVLDACFTSSEQQGPVKV
jgi:predicted dehydrogenase